MRRRDEDHVRRGGIGRAALRLMAQGRAIARKEARQHPGVSRCEGPDHHLGGAGCRAALHAHAQAQCRGWLSENLPHATYLPALSTAAAAAGLTAPPGHDGALGYDAALCAPIAAHRYGLEVLAEHVEDNPGAVTRFVLVGRPAPPPPRTGADKTTLLVHLADDHAGALLELLEQFATRGVNLTRIESRPRGDALGQYAFSIDCEGHVEDERVAEALIGLHRTSPFVRYLGSYPRADGRPTEVTTSTTDGAFTAARAWVSRLREGRS